jgi:GMP synthase-like glutamine amidotransferase
MHSGLCGKKSMPSTVNSVAENSFSAAAVDECAQTGEVLIFQHDPFEDAGLFAEVLDKQRASYRTVRLYHGETPTDDCQEIRALIILGGSMRVSDEEKYPVLRWEKRIIRAAIDEGIPILAVGLGAELLATVLGAAVYHGPVKEIGWYSISLSPYGQADRFLGYLSESATVFQWHGGGFDLPRGAVQLASSLNYNNQAFRLGKNIYGLQFHLEVTARTIERWVHERGKDLALAPYILPDKILEGIRIYAPTLNFYAEKFLSEFIRRTTKSKGSDHKSCGRLHEVGGRM